MSGAVVGSVNGGEGIFARESLVEPHRSEVFADALGWIGEGFGNPAWRSRGGQKFRAVGHGPECEQRPHTSNRTGSRSGIRHERDIAQPQVLAETFVICEEKSFVLFERSAERCAKHIPLKLWDRAMIEEVARVQRTVTQKFVRAPMEAICARGRDNIDLRARTLAVFGSVRVFHDGKFSDGIHTQKLAADSARSVVDLGSARILNAVEQ